jgi:hypothetical protein
VRRGAQSRHPCTNLKVKLTSVLSVFSSGCKVQYDVLNVRVKLRVSVKEVLRRLREGAAGRSWSLRRLGEGVPRGWVSFRRLGEGVPWGWVCFRRLGEEIPRGWGASEDWERKYQGDGRALEDWERE